MLGTVIAFGALALSAGLNGLAIWFYKDYERLEQENLELHSATEDQEYQIETLTREVIALRKKTTPWNKGKSGYKLQPRARKIEVPHFHLHQDDSAVPDDIATFERVFDNQENQNLFTPRID